MTFIHFLSPINEQRTNDGRKIIFERYLTKKTYPTELSG